MTTYWRHWHTNCPVSVAVPNMPLRHRRPDEEVSVSIIFGARVISVIAKAGDLLNIVVAEGWHENTFDDTAWIE